MIRDTEENRTESAARSIIVKGSSVEDAVSKGLFLLGVTRQEITYQVLQQGVRGRNGLVGTPYKLRITVGGENPLPASEESAAAPEDAFTSGVPEMRAEDLMPLSSPDFLALLDLVEVCVRPVTPAQTAVESVAWDGEVQVEVAPSRMEAFATVTPPHGGGREAGAVDVHAALEAAGVRYGIDEAAVAEAVRRRGARIVVAAGLPPRAGADACFRFMGDNGALADEPPIGRQVEPNQVVAVKTPAGEGASGMSVLGETLPPHMGRDLSLHALRGRNLRVSPDGRELSATASGVVSLIDGKLHVEEALVIAHDVTSSGGSVSFVGDIIIQGSVGRGVSVRAGGHITVTGNVDVAVVQAGGSITVGGGIRGRGMGTVRAQGSVTCRFVEDARIHAGGDVQIEEYMRGGDVRADRRAVVNGSVTGGQVYGVLGVRVRIAGNEQQIPTTLMAGNALRFREESERARVRIAALTERLQAVEAFIAQQLAGERQGTPLPPEQRVEVVKSVEEKARLRAEISQLAEQKNALLNRLEDQRSAMVSVTQKAHPRTRIVIDEAALELPTATQYANFTRDTATSAIRLTALK